MAILFSKIDMIKLVRKATFPTLGLVNAKTLVEAFCGGFNGFTISKYSDLEPLLNLCWAYNTKTIQFDDNEIVWAKSPILSESELKNLSTNPTAYIKY